MFTKRTIALLIAGSFCAAQAGAHSYMSEASSSPRAYEYQALSEASEDSFPHTLTVFNPDGTSYSLVAEAYDVVLEPALIVMTDESLPDQLTVFDPDGTVTSYQFTPVDVTYLEPQLNLTAIDPSDPSAGETIAYAADTPVILVEVAEPLIVAMTDDDTLALVDDEGNSYIVWFDEEGAPWSFPSHMAAFDAALERTG